MNSEFGILYLIPCPISDETAPWDVLPAANRDVMNSLDYFIVEKHPHGAAFPVESRHRAAHRRTGIPRTERAHRGRPRNRGADRAAARRPLGGGVISEAGVPGVADPGALVVEACHRRGIRVVPLVGPSSIILAVMASGLNGQSFAFNGYLPVKPPERTRAIRFFERRALSEGQSQLFIEAPYRNVKLMEQLVQTLGRPAPDRRRGPHGSRTSGSRPIRPGSGAPPSAEPPIIG